MSARAAAASITGRACSAVHSRGRKLVSKETPTPAARAMPMAAATVSAADALIAWLMPEACRKLRARDELRLRGRRAS